MGNCVGKSEKLTAEIVPHDGGGGGGAQAYPTVRLYGSPKSVLAAYIRFALLHKAVSLDFVPSDPDQSPVTLQVGSDTVSGSRETLLRFIDARFPNPPLTRPPPAATPLMVRLTRLQHKSMLWHVKRVMRWAEDLATRGGRKAVDPTVGSPRMEMKKFARSYSQLLEVMLEHAQMEERVLFPIFDMADRGLSKAAKEEHARDLPLMNGIKEVIKSVGVLDAGSPGYREALSNLSARLKSLQGQCKQHFKEEEVELLPLMEAVEMSKEQEQNAVEQSFEVMQATHSRLLKFLLEGLSPHDSMKYLDLISNCRNREKKEAMLRMIVE
ncbi:hemerythrin HHE cation-binding domain protein [Senna tora]|uniref:Hemerythrin HHE cation-binding domain protein n=1 Tax=Senna tora TaxID=362788 RepID=A0A834TGC3_9FABA|nr:hemerythrin HHE cation-binding domain protein [Senna tora]